jgi:archaeosine-15-forming tRNA-guanine transglycosylase
MPAVIDSLGDSIAVVNDQGLIISVVRADVNLVQIRRLESGALTGT